MRRNYRITIGLRELVHVDGENLKTLRGPRTQDELAKLSRVSARTIRTAERNGEISFGKLRRLAKALRKSWTQLVPPDELEHLADGPAALNGSTTNAEYDFGEVYASSFNDWLPSITDIESVLLASTFGELRHLWWSSKGTSTLASNLKLIQAGKRVSRLFLLERSPENSRQSYFHALTEAFWHHLLGVDVRILFKDEFDKEFDKRMDMVGIHDDRFSSFYNLTNETILAGTDHTRSQVLESIERYKESFARAQSVERFLDMHGITSSPNLRWKLEEAANSLRRCDLEAAIRLHLRPADLHQHPDMKILRELKHLRETTSINGLWRLV